MLKCLLPPLLLLLLALSFPSGNSAIDVVERIVLASGLGETSEFVARLSEAYAYTDKEVRIQYTAAAGAEFALDLFETCRSDIAILPSAILSILLGDIKLVVQGYDDPKDEASSITGVFGLPRFARSVGHWRRL